MKKLLAIVLAFSFAGLIFAQSVASANPETVGADYRFYENYRCKI